MGLPWVRLDCGFPRNPKILALLRERDGYRAALAYICALAYCGEQGTDGFIPDEALPHVHARRSDGLLLAKYELWHEQPGGYTVHDWIDKQASSDESHRRRVRAQAGAAARWEGHEAAGGAARTRQWRERRAGVDDAS